MIRHFYVTEKVWVDLQNKSISDLEKQALSMGHSIKTSLSEYKYKLKGAGYDTIYHLADIHIRPEERFD